MTATIGVDVLVGLAVLGLIVYRQLQVRPVRDTMGLALILAVIGVIELAQYHLGYDYFVDGKGSQSGLGSASLLLYFAITFTIQRLILQARAQRIAGPPRNTGAPNASW